MSMRDARRGFTLIEISIVMVVIGLLLGAGLTAFAPNIRSSQIKETRRSMTLVEQAMVAYAIRYGCLPCPALGSIAVGDAGYGEAQDETVGVYPGPCTDNACITADGVVPWLTLSMAEEDASDAWGNRLTYYLDTSFSEVQRSNPISSPCPKLGDYSDYMDDYQGRSMCRATMQYPRGHIRIFNAAGVEVTGCSADGTAACDADDYGALYVLVSHGPNGVGAWSARSAVRQAGAATASQSENSDGDADFIQDRPNETAGGYFDDIVIWRSGPLAVDACGNYACGN